MNISKMNIGELAAYVCSYLKSKGIECVLTGGACVSIYSSNKYMSDDLDFIEMTYNKKSDLKGVLSEIGFVERNRYFIHKNTHFFIEFPTGPLSIGNDRIDKVNTLTFESGELSLLNPTDCIKDRLAAYYYWDDLQSLEQAKLVAVNQEYDIKEIERWSQSEGQSAQFNNIKKFF